MHIEQRPITSIQPYEKNPRHNAQAVEAVARSIRAFGFRQPIVVDEFGVIVVGDTRYKAALRLSLDFGGINTCGVFLAEDPASKDLFVYREYRPFQGGGGGTKTARQHVEALLAGEPKLPMAVGGARSEQNWREEFCAAGLPVMEPEILDSTTAARNSSSVEVGISRVYAAINAGKVRFFDHLHGLLDEIESYSRKTDERGEPTDEIEDKESYHGLDSLRYIVGHLRRPTDARWVIGLPDPRAGQGSLIAQAPEGVFIDPRGDWRSSDKRLNERVKNAIGIRKLMECEDF